MKQRKLNFFLVNTPFQGYVVDRIIEQYFCSDLYENIIVSTFVFSKSSSASVLRIKRGIWGFGDIKQMKSIIRENINRSSFFIPHLNNLFSPYFFYLCNKYNRPINVYYEGVALFYSPTVRNNKRLTCKRMIISMISGIKYKKYTVFFPDELVQKATCFTPIESFCKKYNQICRISLKCACLLKGNNLLVLLSPKMIQDDIERIRNYVCSYVSLCNCEKIFIKPHYSSCDSDIYRIDEILRVETESEVIVLDKTIPVENLYEIISFNKIVSLHFSSALINVKLLFNTNVDIEVLSEIQNKELLSIAKEMEIVP